MELVVALLSSLLLLVGCLEGFVLEGSQTSYAQFRKWNAGLNGSLELEFKTEQPNGLLLYTDDGGTYDFFEIKLVEGALRLRYNLGGGAQILTVGRDLNDGHWHKVQVERRGETTSLTVDGVTQSKSSRGKEFHFGRLESNSDVYVGGMPAWYNTKLTKLALPSVIFEPRFGGSIRNLVYADDEGGPPRRQEMKQGEYNHQCTGLHCSNKLPLEVDKTSASPSLSLSAARGGNTTDACEDHDPCQHGGICISTDSGPICECRNLDFEGTYCEKDKAPSEATFRGFEYLWYDLSRTGAEPIVSTQDLITLSFKTRKANGLLFYTGDGVDFLNLYLRDGAVSLSMALGGGKLEMTIKPNRVRFDDHQWHRVTVQRRVQEISSATTFCRLSAVVDGVYSDSAHVAGSFTLLASSRVFVGGSPNTHALFGSRVHANFIGCLRKVEFSADTLILNLIELARTGNKLVSISGRPDFMCQDAESADPVTFTNRESTLILPSMESSRSGSISFKLRTIESHGVLIYSSGTKPLHTNLLAFELFNGHVYLHVDLGSGAIKVKATSRRVDDGLWHEVTLRRDGKLGRVTVDETAADFTTPGESVELDLDGPLYIGGLGPTSAHQTRMPPGLWSGVLRYGYVGCLRDLVVNGSPIDMAEFARHQDAGSIEPTCNVRSPQCDSQPCLNGGICTEGWNRFICDCAATGFVGPTCGKEASTLNFNGSQHLSITKGGADEWRTQTEDVALRFRTARPLGLLLATSSEQSQDRLELAVTAGRVRLTIRLGDREKFLQSGQGLNDNQWHTLRYTRRSSSLKLQVDDDTPARADTVLDKQNTLEYRTLHIGGWESYQILTTPSSSTTSSSTTSNNVITGGMPGFIGSIQQLTVNGQQWIELARTTTSPNIPPLTSSGDYQPRIRLTAKYGRRDHQMVHHSVTFKSKHTFVGLPVLKAYQATNIYFQFKTRDANGLILYNAGRENDFVAVELVSGHLHYLFNLGDGPVRVRDNARNSLNDNRWHAVTIGRPNAKQHSLMVDDNFAIVNSLGTNENLDLAGILYLGGVTKTIYSQLPKQIQSRHGFEGCLASLDLNGESPDLFLDAVVPSPQLAHGCEGPSTKCSHSVCANRGACVQQHWNAYACDCDMTSYTGPTCSDESVAYEFGPGRGLITFVYPNDRRPELKTDVMALGFITTQSDAVLLRLDSATSHDYLEIEIVEGNIFAVYNMGTADHPIGEPGVRVSDNQYHVVRFTRAGPNSTLQVDDYNVQTNHPQGHQLSVFNSEGTVQVGGKWNSEKQRVERPFNGVLSGLVLNGLRILDLAAEKDPRTTVRGDARLLTSLGDRIHGPLQRMQQTPASGYPVIKDDLVFSGAGSGCNADDEDECAPVFEAGSGDDLITPVYVPPTRPPHSEGKGPPGGDGNAAKPCDDEDCFTGSGSGEVTTEEAKQTKEGTATWSESSASTSEVPPSSSGPGTSGQPDGSSLEPGETSPAPGAGQSTLSGSTSGSGSTPGGGLFPPGTDSPGPPPIYLPPTPPASEGDSPPQGPPQQHPPRRHPTSKIPADNTDYMLFIVCIVAGTMIAIVFIIILITIRYKSRGDISYKVDESKCSSSYAAGSASGAACQGAGSMPQQNGALKNGNKTSGNCQGSSAKKQSKDVKEWYV